MLPIASSRVERLRPTPASRSSARTRRPRRASRARRTEPLGRDPRGVDVAVADARLPAQPARAARSRSARRTSRVAPGASAAPSGSGTSHSASSASCSSSTSRTVGATSSVGGGDRRLVERADVVGRRARGRQPAAQRHRARAALLERRVVEERVRVRVDQLVRQRARLDGVARHHLDLAALELLDHPAQAARGPSPRRGSRGSSRTRAGDRGSRAAR